jgi:hypothetical protein
MDFTNSEPAVVGADYLDSLSLYYATCEVTVPYQNGYQPLNWRKLIQ